MSNNNTNNTNNTFNDDEETHKKNNKNYQFADRRNVEKLTRLLLEHDELTMHVSNLIADFLEYGGEECAGYVSSQLRNDTAAMHMPFPKSTLATAQETNTQDTNVQETTSPGTDAPFLKPITPRLHSTFNPEEREQIQKELNKYFDALCDKYQRFDKTLRHACNVFFARVHV
ncbi:hypothetical protein RFI_09339, partial [Reticulomyxa filosa]